MEEKLFWISLVSGVYALAFKRFLKVPKRLDNPVGVCLLNGLFWAFVGVAAGFLVVSYRELNTLSVPLGVACAGAGGLLGVAWVLPSPLTLASFLWPVQTVTFSVALGGLLGVPAGALAVGAVGLGLLGVAAGQLARGSSVPLARAAVSGLLCAEGALAGYWFSSSGGGNPSLVVPLVLAAGGYVVGHGWRPRARWSADENAVRLRESLEWADTGFSAILLASVIMYFVVQAFKIPSGSMRSTLLEGDHLFVNKFIYGLRVPYTGRRVVRFREVQRGDIVVFRFPTDNKSSSHYGKDFIKRAIALPGDTVEIRDKKVFVNGHVLTEPFAQFEDDYLIPPADLLAEKDRFQELWETRRLDRAPGGEIVRDNFGPVLVPPRSYFVMGDNRDRSFDGRFWGPMPDTHLKGKAWILYWPFSRWKIIR